MPPVKTVFIQTLTDRAVGPRRVDTRRFLQGLAGDELQFIAGFLGACIVEGGESAAVVPAVYEGYRISRSKIGIAADREHKMLVLREYLLKCGIAGDRLTAMGLTE